MKKRRVLKILRFFVNNERSEEDREVREKKWILSRECKGYFELVDEDHWKVDNRAVVWYLAELKQEKESL